MKKLIKSFGYEIRGIFQLIRYEHTASYRAPKPSIPHEYEKGGSHEQPFLVINY